MVKKVDEDRVLPRILDSVFTIPQPPVPILPKLPKWKEGWAEPTKLKWLEAWTACIGYFSRVKEELQHVGVRNAN